MGRADNTKEPENTGGARGEWEWEDGAAGSAGPQPNAAPAALAPEPRPPLRSKRKTGTPESLEEAIRSVMPDEDDELDDQPVRYPASAEHAHR